MSSNKFKRQVSKVVKRVGVDDHEITVAGSGHLQVTIWVNGESRKITTAKTPSCNRVIKNFEARLVRTKTEMMEA